jgi:hypothetical protein
MLFNLQKQGSQQRSRSRAETELAVQECQPTRRSQAQPRREACGRAASSQIFQIFSWDDPLQQPPYFDYLLLSALYFT